MALLGLGLNIHPNSKQNIFRGFLDNDFLFLVLVSVSLGASWLVSKGFKLSFSVAPVLLNVDENVGRDVIVLFVDDVSDLLNVVLTPCNFGVIVL